MENGESVKPPAKSPKPSNAVLQQPAVESVGLAGNSGAEEPIGKEKEIVDYLKEILRVSRERFFDTDQAITLAKEDYQFIPGYASVVGVSNSQGTMDVVVTYLNGLTSNMGILSENIGGEEVHVSYRQKTAQGKFSKMLRKVNYNYGSMVFPSKDGEPHRMRKPYSLKSTMRKYDVERWEAGDTSTNTSMGFYGEQVRLEPTAADYEAVLDTVKRGSKNVNLTNNTVLHLKSQNKISGYLTEQDMSDALSNLQARTNAILKGEQLASESAAYSKKLLGEAVIEKGQPNEESFEIAQRRLQDIALSFPGVDGEVIYSVADSLGEVSKTLDIVHTILGSDDPTIKTRLRSLTKDNSLPELNAEEMMALLDHLTQHSKFYDFRKSAGFSTDALYGTPLSDKYGPEKDEKGGLIRREASQKAKLEILRTLGFLRPGEQLANRIDRIAGEPEYAKDNSLFLFRYNPETGESISWDPYSAKKYSSVEITSPLFGSKVTAQVGVELRVARDNNRDRLEPTDEGIDFITLRINSGEAVMRLSKDRSRLRIGQKEDETNI